MMEQMPAPRPQTGSSEQKPPNNDKKGTSRGPRFLEACFKTCSRLLREGNRRQLLLRNASGRTVLRLPLTATALIALFLLWRVPILLILAVLIALALRVQMAIYREENVEDSNGVST